MPPVFNVWSEIDSCTSIRLLIDEPRAVSSQGVYHSNQIRQRSSLHLSHNRASMHLDRYLTQAKLSRNLLVHSSRCHQHHDFSLAGRKCCKPACGRGKPTACNPTRAVAIYCIRNRIDHVLVAEWLGKEIDGASFHSPDRHR